MTTDQMQMFGGSWTEQKLEILSKYLHEYNKALKYQSFTRVYVDAFAGTGYRQQRQKEFNLPELFDDVHQDEPQEFLKGSAKLALEVEPSFHRYIFVESDPTKTAELEKLKREHPSKASQVEIITADANEYVKKFCATQNWRNVRAVLFLDPFATEVEWTTIEAIAKTAAIDVWILFPLMAVNRLLASDPKKACRAALDRIFGTPEWFDRFYSTRKVDDFFESALEKVEKDGNFDSISEFYTERLKGIFAGVAPKARIFRNQKESPLFQLFFAAGNPKGAPIAVGIAKYLLEKL
jgi:three-Cys-motif partner protein